MFLKCCSACFNFFILYLLLCTKTPKQPICNNLDLTVDVILIPLSVSMQSILKLKYHISCQNMPKLTALLSFLPAVLAFSVYHSRPLQANSVACDKVRRSRSRRNLLNISWYRIQILHSRLKNNLTTQQLYII